MWELNRPFDTVKSGDPRLLRLRAGLNAKSMETAEAVLQQKNEIIAVRVRGVSLN